MDKKEIEHIIDKTGALQNGHFLLSSGLHSPTYFQAALMLHYPQYLQRFCREIVEFYQEEEDAIDVVVAPAVGGIVVAQEVGRQLEVRSLYAEREGGKMTLRRGFKVDPHEAVLIAEDVITTGGSVKEVAELMENIGAFVVGIACIVDRSGGVSDLDIPVFSVYSKKMITYKPENCPLCQQNIPLTEQGSRNL